MLRRWWARPPFERFSVACFVIVFTVVAGMAVLGGAIAIFSALGWWAFIVMPVAAGTISGAIILIDED